MSFVLHESAYRRIKRVVDDVVRRCHLDMALLVDKNGLLVAASGDVQNMDTTSLAALTVGCVSTDGLAEVAGERASQVFWHRGASASVVVVVVDDRVVLSLILRRPYAKGFVDFQLKRTKEDIVQIFRDMEEEAKDDGGLGGFGGSGGGTSGFGGSGAPSHDAADVVQPQLWC